MALYTLARYSILGVHPTFFLFDIMLTLSGHFCSFWDLYHGYCPPDRISTKTDTSKLMHGLQSHIEPTLDWPCSAAHNFVGNAILQSIIAFPVTFKGLMEPVFNQALKAGHVGFVTDTYIQCISSSL